jgi:hypothetical protein
MLSGYQMCRQRWLPRNKLQQNKASRQWLWRERIYTVLGVLLLIMLLLVMMTMAAIHQLQHGEHNMQAANHTTCAKRSTAEHDKAR